MIFATRVYLMHSLNTYTLYEMTDILISLTAAIILKCISEHKLCAFNVLIFYLSIAFQENRKRNEESQQMESIVQRRECRRHK